MASGGASTAATDAYSFPHMAQADESACRMGGEVRRSHGLWGPAGRTLPFVAKSLLQRTCSLGGMG